MTFSSSARTSGGSSGPGGYNPAYGGIPNLPRYVTDTQTSVGPDVQGQMIRNLPGYLNLSSADSANIASNLAGGIPGDVLDLLQQGAAERGIATGSPGSDNSNAAYLRALGLTSLQLQQLGHTQLTEAMGRTPIQNTQTVNSTRDLGAEKAIYESAPVPESAARQAIIDTSAGYSRGLGGHGGSAAGTVPGRNWASGPSSWFTGARDLYNMMYS